MADTCRSSGHAFATSHRKVHHRPGSFQVSGVRECSPSTRVPSVRVAFGQERPVVNNVFLFRGRDGAADVDRDGLEVVERVSGGACERWTTP